MDETELPWFNDKKHITEVYFEAININNLELFRIIRLNLNQTQAILPLIIFITDRLETVTTLITNNKIWDSEIILRSAMETLVKFVFITTAENGEREKRIDEVWNLLAEVNSLKQSEQAKKNLIHFSESEIHFLAYSPLLLSDEREIELRAKWTKAERKRLEQKWSFTEIVNSLSKDYRGKPMEFLVTLSHGYRISSHVTHGDETGISIIRERNSRLSRDKEIADFSHYLRLLSDVFNFCAIVSIETMYFLNLEKDFFFKNAERLNSVKDLFEKYQNDLFEDKDYDKYRNKH